MSQPASARVDGVRDLAAAGAVRVEQAVEAMTSSLRAAILGGELEAGTLLPTERDLVEQSGLSRGSVRQALKSLTVEGLLSAKVGRNGGYLVQQPPREAVVRSLDVFIRGRRIHHNSLLEVREVIEPRCAALAAQRRDDVTLRRLAELTEQMAGVTGDITTFLDMNIDWHVAVADASGNEVFASIMTAISTNVRSAISVDDYRSVAMMAHAQHLHEVVLDAIERQDVDAAERRMRRHLHAANSVVEGDGQSAPTRRRPPAKTAKKAPAKEAPAKKTAAKKTAAKKTAAKKTAAKKTAAKKTAAKKTAAKKTAAKKTAAKKTAKRSGRVGDDNR